MDRAASSGIDQSSGSPAATPGERPSTLAGLPRASFRADPFGSLDARAGRMRRCATCLRARRGEGRICLRITLGEDRRYRAKTYPVLASSSSPSSPADRSDDPWPAQPRHPRRGPSYGRGRGWRCISGGRRSPSPLPLPAATAGAGWSSERPAEIAVPALRRSGVRGSRAVPRPVGCLGGQLKFV